MVLEVERTLKFKVTLLLCQNFRLTVFHKMVQITLFKNISNSKME